MTEPVLGIDRWRKGWAIAEASGSRITFTTAATIEGVLHRWTDIAVVAIDMPLSLPLEGERSAELALRSRLGRASRSVFMSPTRAAVTASDQAEATIVNRANGGKGVSAQAWGLVKSIRECRDILCDHPARDRWFETHPEALFAVLCGAPLPSKKTGVGVGRRLAALSEVFPDLLASLQQGPDGVPVDDLLDAAACAVAAQRVLLDAADVIGRAGRDDEGFPLGIRV